MTDRETQSYLMRVPLEGACIENAEEAKAFLRQYLCPGVHPRLMDEASPATCMAMQAFYEAAERCRNNDEEAQREGLPTGEIHYLALQPPDEAAFHAMGLPTTGAFDDGRAAPTNTTFEKVRNFLDYRKRFRLVLLTAGLNVEATRWFCERLTSEQCSDFFPLDFTWAQWTQLLHDFPTEDCHYICLREREHWSIIYGGGRRG
ncbi:hypothetical protein E4U61_005634 [Claviceps capensis]|nr:hypothetical protein E4U61_005634 [Claviceps capensis]